ncbi:protein jag [Bombilactobacillus folatiphilus]|uniref:RNA-binding protein KhpB n=1 Tax=Bombilactobacillus folatiphilus TaxID=2923362 RepID=A0ABY4P8Y4_9LACO|nr:RNA-binding cell elongation regulator Jag/EloR [Bombilactobacillus folatiphilus]UQS82133.1 protein jag [Bombilactobacillus folatiphilus]
MAEFKGATIQKAIDAGLQQLNVTREQVAVDVISEGRSGFLGIGRKPAVVELKPIESIQTMVAQTQADSTKVAQIQDYLEQILHTVGLDQVIEYVKSSECLKFNVQVSADLQARVIGKHGRNLNALQTIVQEYAYYLGFREQPVLLDVGNYRKRRQEALVALSTFKAEQVCATKKPVYLDAMPAIERKIIYQNLENNDDVFVRTQGHGLDRYLVIRPVRAVKK